MAINLLPWREEVYAKRKQIFSGIFLVGLILIIGSTWGIHQGVKKKKAFIRYQHQLLSQQIQVLQKKAQTRLAVYSGDQRKEEKRLWISKIFQEQTRLFSFLEKLGKMNFKERYLVELSFEKEQLKLKGIAVSMLNIFHFMEALKCFPELKEIQFMGAEQLQGGFQFNLAMKLN